MKKILIGLLLIGFLKGILLIFLIPPWNAEDELHHWGYADALWRNKTLLLQEEQEYISQGSLDFYAETNTKVVSKNELRRVDAETSMKRLEVSTTHHLTTTYQPPLYYLPIAWLWRVMGSRSILDSLYWARATSVVWYTFTLWGLWKLSGLLKVDRKYQFLTLIVALGWPQFSFLGSVVNPHIAEICLFTWGTVLLIHAIKLKFRWKITLAISLNLIGLMLVKHTSIIYAVMIGGAIIWAWKRSLLKLRGVILRLGFLVTMGLIGLYPYKLINENNIYLGHRDDLLPLSLGNYLLNTWDTQKQWLLEGFWEVRVSSVFGAGSTWITIGVFLMILALVGVMIRIFKKNLNKDDLFILVIGLVGAGLLNMMLLYWGYLNTTSQGVTWLKGRYWLSAIPMYLIIARYGLATIIQGEMIRKLFRLFVFVWITSYQVVSWIILLTSFYLIRSL